MNQLVVSKEKLNDLKRSLTAGADSMALILPKSITPETMIRFALNAAQNNPKLLLCSVQSIGLALMNSSAIGLEPNGYDGHLVPYEDKNNSCFTCQFIPDYKGYTKLMHQNPKLQSVSAGAVREGDLFEFEFGTDAYLRHIPPLKDDRGDLIAAWAMYKLQDGSSDFVVLTQGEVLKHKRASPSSGGYKSPWKLWEDPMWAKTAIRILRKFAPMGPGVEKASAYEDAIETGTLPTDHVYDADPDGPRLTFDVEPQHHNEFSQPQSRSQELADKMGAQNAAPTTTAPPEPTQSKKRSRKPLTEKQLHGAIQSAVNSGDRQQLTDFITRLDESLDANQINEDMYNMWKEQASIAIEQLVAP
ncbi:recombinase RecT [Gimesia fumaroli]|uniref:Recombination and repair protein RecT n=1 Tax=Gimesia fumaroli TaxID=2527976 RepID=A0A518I911_9PLAN|nr:recombinase RecT [Gimesia fumaroli]QDV49587.1 recombination and repair protein RecT [Gimesia fumaroli]